MKADNDYYLQIDVSGPSGDELAEQVPDELVRRDVLQMDPLLLPVIPPPRLLAHLFMRLPVSDARQCFLLGLEVLG